MSSETSLKTGDEPFLIGLRHPPGECWWLIKWSPIAAASSRGLSSPVARCSRSSGPINPAPPAITTIKDADAIYVLVEGQVVQFGTYDSLLSQ